MLSPDLLGEFDVIQLKEAEMSTQFLNRYVIKSSNDNDILLMH
jgi:hypothetical protein